MCGINLQMALSTCIINTCPWDHQTIWNLEMTKTSEKNKSKGIFCFISQENRAAVLITVTRPCHYFFWKCRKMFCALSRRNRFKLVFILLASVIVCSSWISPLRRSLMLMHSCDYIIDQKPKSIWKLGTWSTIHLFFLDKKFVSSLAYTF